MQNLTRASNELFRRTPDECFPSMQALWDHCHKRRESSLDHWHPPQHLRPHVSEGRIALAFGGDRPFAMNDWSFAQLCRLANVSKDTINVHESLNEIRRIILNLVEKRDERRDAFATVIKRACQETLGPTGDEVMQVLQRHGITKTLAKQAVEIARRHGGFTIFAVVDALTRLSAKIAHAGDRAETDEKTGRLLALASNGGGTKTSSRQLAAAVA